MAAIIIGELLQGGVFAVVALGFALVYRATGVINLSQGAFCVVGALTMYTLEQTLGWPASLAAAGAVLATTLFGAALGAATFVPALARLPNSTMLMLTAGLLTLIQGLVLVLWGSQPYDLPAFSGEAPVEVFGVRVATQGFWIVGMVVRRHSCALVSAVTHHCRQAAARLAGVRLRYCRPEVEKGRAGPEAKRSRRLR